jgi:hypothetical protein
MLIYGIGYLLIGAVLAYRSRAELREPVGVSVAIVTTLWPVLLIAGAIITLRRI